MLFLSIGECMIEMSASGADQWRSGFAGDTLNTAWYMRKALPADWQVGYLTRVGTDPLSQRMVDFFGEAGITDEFVSRDPVRVPGLYMISLKDGERSFTYWRDNSAARGLADDPDHLAAALDAADLAYLSGITLGILSPEKRQVLLDALQRRKQAGKPTAFDPNLRPRLWSSADEMCSAVMQAAALCSIALPSHEDEATYFGDADPQATAQRYLDAGADEVLVKNGGGQMMIALGDAPMQVIDMGAAVKPVDTTGAGDSFNGGYLSGRLTGQSPEQAAAQGHAIALQVIAVPGALVSDLRL